MKRFLLFMLTGCFVFSGIAAAAAYYIDYEKGDDNNSGTKEKPFKHHPWDINAGGKALSTKGINTYNFKKGVIYRGTLSAKESGEDGNPIRLTVDNGWGEGPAMMYGSERVTAVWKKTNDASIPAEGRANVWYVDLDKSYVPHMVYELKKDGAIKLDLARTPNWKVTNPDDPRSGWWEWNSVYYDEKTRTHTLKDPEHLKQKEADFWKGATVWSELWVGVAEKPAPILGYDPKAGALKANFNRDSDDGPHQNFRYYIEDHPSLLDSPNEFYYDKDKGRLYLWLEGNRNPNEAKIELAKQLFGVTIEKKRNIVIDGLSLSFYNRIDYVTNHKVHRGRYFCSAIQLKGSVQNIKILNCNLEYLPHGIIGFPFQKNDLLENIEISKNIIRHIEGQAIHINLSGYYYEKEFINLDELKARMRRVLVKGNNIFDAGFRNMSFYEEQGDGIGIYHGETVEVCDNIVDTVASQGIDVYNGLNYDKSKQEYPLIRSLIHDNVVTNSVLDTQDYGGIEAWHAGPCYIYNNISGNAVGYIYAKFKKDGLEEAYRSTSWATGIYMDGVYKAYVFNNIIWGNNGDAAKNAIYNSAGINEAMGFLKVVFNNTMYNLATGLHKDMPQSNRNYYLNNLYLDIAYKFIQHDIVQKKTIGYTTLAFAGNVFQGTPLNFALLGDEDDPPSETIEDWRKFLKSNKAMVSDSGVATKNLQVEDMKKHNFKPRKGSEVIDKAKKVFVPWSLYKVTGEWGFYKHLADPKRIIGESVDFNKEWKQRDMFLDIPQNDLSGINVTDTSFKKGILEDWVDGALEFNGLNRYCELKNSEALDMSTNNFLIEAVLNGKKGPVVSKVDGKNGYSLVLQEDGKLRLSVLSEGTETACESEKPANDGNWHHVIAQVDRSKGLEIFVDGKSATGKKSGEVKGNLANSGAFLVGKKGESYFSGMLDFLRISKGTLADAETTIEELYKWEFDGPFLKDFYGKPMQGKARDVGAVEYSETDGSSSALPNEAAAVSVVAPAVSSKTAVQTSVSLSTATKFFKCSYCSYGIIKGAVVKNGKCPDCKANLIEYHCDSCNITTKEAGKCPKCAKEMKKVLGWE